jgi:Concanavalin A-like lectin/glucanases superfamily/Bacterial lectin/PKD domain/Carboxypeptidase regulatory-like domain
MAMKKSIRLLIPLIAACLVLGMTFYVAGVSRRAAAQVTNQQLTPPHLIFAPTSLVVSPTVGEVITLSMTMTNLGTESLSFTFQGFTISDDFSTDSGYWSYGREAYRDVNNGYVVLTEPVGGQVGTLWLKTRFNQSFTVDFRYFMGGGSGADGMTIMFYKDRDYLAGPGECEGFGAHPLCNAPGYGIELDSYTNWFEPYSPHVALIQDTVRNHLAVTEDGHIGDNQWHEVHLVVGSDTVSVSLDGTEVLSWQGELVREFNSLGFSAACGGLDDWHLIDDVTITATGMPVPAWLQIDPLSSTIPSLSELPVQFTFDTAGLQPGVYTTTLNILSNDPISPSLPVPVTMTVAPISGMGWMEGVVSDLRTGEPLVATLTAIGQPYTVTSDAGSGAYLFWLEPGTYTIEVRAPGYVTETAGVVITTQQGITQDFALLLDAPWLEYFPDHLSVLVKSGQTITETLALTSSGTGPLNFHFYNVTNPGAVLMLHLDEPPGSIYFSDLSGIGNHGFCSGDGCPITGAEGVVDRAILLDGVDDMVRVGPYDSLVMTNAVTIAAWIYPTLEPSFGGWMIVNRESEYELGRGENGTLQWAFFRVGGYGWWWFDTGYYVPLDQWTHVAVVYDNGDVTAYANGDQVSFDDGEGLIGDGDPDHNELRVGGRSNEDSRFSGLIDEVIIYRAALTASEIQAIYEGGEVSAPWLSFEPISGTIPTTSSTEARLTIDTTGLLAGVYTATLNIASNDPLQLNVAIPLTMTVVDLPLSGLVAINDSPIPLGLPNTLSATVTSGTNAIYSWDFGDGGTGEGAVIRHRYPAAGIYTATVSAVNSVNMLTSYTIVTVPIQTTYFPLVTRSSQPPLAPASASSLPGVGVLVTLVIFGMAGRWKRSG